MSDFKRKLRVVFEKGAVIGSNDLHRNSDQDHRYVPRSLTGGTGWGIYDRNEARFLKDQEVKRLPYDRLANERLGNPLSVH